MTKDEILKRIERVEEEQNFLQRACRALVCPRCGNDLVRAHPNGECDDDVRYVYYCRSACGFRHEEKT